MQFDSGTFNMGIFGALLECAAVMDRSPNFVLAILIHIVDEASKDRQNNSRTRKQYNAHFVYFRVSTNSVKQHVQYYAARKQEKHIEDSRKRKRKQQFCSQSAIQYTQKKKRSSDTKYDIKNPECIHNKQEIN